MKFLDKLTAMQLLQNDVLLKNTLQVTHNSCILLCINMILSICIVCLKSWTNCKLNSQAITVQNVLAHTESV